MILGSMNFKPQFGFILRPRRFYDLYNRLHHGHFHQNAWGGGGSSPSCGTSLLAQSARITHLNPT